MFTIPSLIKRIGIVRKIPVFASLGWLQVQSIARCGDVVRYRKGDCVSREGNSPDFVFFLVSGRLQAFRTDSDGKKDDVEFVHRGMFFGIISALTGEKHSQTFEAINDSIIFRISVENFRRQLTWNPGLGVKFSKVLSQRIRSRVTKDNVSRSMLISVYSPMVGGGGSTYALNLALTLRRETNDRVILVSIRSAEGHARSPASGEPTFLPGLSPVWRRDPADLKTLAEDFEQTVPSALKQAEFGLDLLNVVFDPKDVDVVLNMSDFVNGFINEYRYIIVDLPSDMDDVVIKTLSQSDCVHLVMGRDRESLVDGRVILDRLEQSLDEDFNADRIKVLVGGTEDLSSALSEPEVRALLDFDVLAYLPHLAPEDLAEQIDTQDIAFTSIKQQSSYQKILTGIVRHMAGVSVGLVLGGGAAFGLAHIGVIKVLEEEGIPVDIIVGSSMGALIGGLWAIGYSAADLTKAANEFRKKSDLFKLMDFVFPLSGLISGKAIMAWLRSKYGDKTFRDARIPIKIVAYDLIHRQDVILETGSLVEAVRKSISIPGVFQPILEQDQIVIDGGVMNPLPTNVLARGNIKRIIAVNVLQSSEDVINSYHQTRKVLNAALETPFLVDPWFFIDTRMKFWFNKYCFPNISDIIVRTLEASEALIANESAKKADVVIHPDLEGLQWYELYKVDALIERGEAAARAQLPKIKGVILKRG